MDILTLITLITITCIVRPMYSYFTQSNVDRQIEEWEQFMKSCGQQISEYKELDDPPLDRIWPDGEDEIIKDEYKFFDRDSIALKEDPDLIYYIVGNKKHYINRTKKLKQS